MSKLPIYLIFAITMLLAVNSAQADAMAKMQLCLGCHGTDTSKDPMYPNLAGQNATYIFNQVQNFKNGNRDDITMSSVVRVINDDDIKVIAAEYAKITPKKNTNADAGLVAKGKITFESTCLACHGAEGLGSENIARLASQKTGYVIKQLQDFKSGKRKNDTMPDIAAELSDDDMKAVAEYISTL